MLIGGQNIPDILVMVVDERQERIMALARCHGLEDVEGGTWATAFMMTDAQLDTEFWFKWHLSVHPPAAVLLS